MHLDSALEAVSTPRFTIFPNVLQTEKPVIGAWINPPPPFRLPSQENKKFLAENTSCSKERWNDHRTQALHENISFSSLYFCSLNLYGAVALETAFDIALVCKFCVVRQWAYSTPFCHPTMDHSGSCRPSQPIWRRECVTCLRAPHVVVTPPKGHVTLTRHWTGFDGS